MDSNDINKLFHSLADTGKLTAKIPVVDIDISARIALLKQRVIKSKSVESQKNELIRELARYCGLDDDERFIDFMKG